MTRSDGTTTPLSTNFNGDLGPEEWAFFGDPAAGRSLFVASHEDDAIADTYTTLQSQMTVFAFGRSGATPLLDSAPRTFSFGLVESLDYDVHARRIRSVIHDVAVTTGTVEALGANPPTANDDVYGTPEDAVLSVDAATGVLANDTDPELDPMQAILVSPTAASTTRRRPRSRASTPSSIRRATASASRATRR
jgi:hypothetical protein